MDEIGRSFPCMEPPTEVVGVDPREQQLEKKVYRSPRQAAEAAALGLQRSISIQRIHISYLPHLLFFFPPSEKPLYATNNIEIKK